MSEAVKAANILDMNKMYDSAEQSFTLGDIQSTGDHLQVADKLADETKERRRDLTDLRRFCDEAKMKRHYEEADKAAAANEVGPRRWHYDQVKALAEKLGVEPRPMSEAVKAANILDMNKMYDSAEQAFALGDIQFTEYHLQNADDLADEIEERRRVLTDLRRFCDEAKMKRHYEEADKAAAANEVSLMRWHYDQVKALPEKLGVEPLPMSEAVKAANIFDMNEMYDSAEQAFEHKDTCLTELYLQRGDEVADEIKERRRDLTDLRRFCDETNMNRHYEEADKAAAANELGKMRWHDNKGTALAKKLGVEPRRMSEAVKAANIRRMNEMYDSAERCVGYKNTQLTELMLKPADEFADKINEPRRALTDLRKSCM